MKKNKSKSKDRKYYYDVVYGTVGRYVTCDYLLERNVGNITYVHENVHDDLELDINSHMDELFFYHSLNAIHKEKRFKSNDYPKFYKIKETRSKRFMTYSFLNGDEYR